jgi:hypothetical protein
MSEIPLTVDESLARLQSIRTQISEDPDLALIEDDLPDELAAVSRAHERLGRIVLENLSIRELWNLNAIWRAHEERLDRWTAAFDDELRGVAVDLRFAVSRAGCTSATGRADGARTGRHGFSRGDHP